MTQWNDPQGRRPEEWEVQQTQHIPPGQGQQYGQPPQYGQQGQRSGQYGPGQPQRMNPFGPEGNETFGIVGAVLALLGFVVLLVAFSALDWFRGGLSFGDVHDALSNRSSAAGFADVYFSWLAWVFAIVAVIAAVGSCFPSPAVRALRILGVVIGVAAAGLSFLAIQLDDVSSYSYFIKGARAGFYLAVAGFLLTAGGAAIGPRKV